MINIKNVSYHYKNSNIILDNLNFDIYEGEVLAIVGKNGSGKSTIGKLISGISKLKTGQILIDNLDISKKKNEKEIRNKIGIVFQNPENQIIFNNIYDELSFSLKNLPKAEINQRIESALKEVEMLEFKDKDLYSLSLGQKQRIMIAEILAKKPKYIILDEPTTMIDSLGKEKIYHIIQNLKKHGYTIICITNLADEILLADRTLLLDSGKIVAELKKENLVQNISYFHQYKIKVPTILEILSGLNTCGFNITLNDYTTTELISVLKGKLANERPY